MSKPAGSIQEQEQADDLKLGWSRLKNSTEPEQVEERNQHDVKTPVNADSVSQAGDGAVLAQSPGEKQEPGLALIAKIAAQGGEPTDKAVR